MKYDKTNLLSLVEPQHEPRLIKLATRSRRPLLPVEKSGPMSQLEIDSRPDGSESEMYSNQVMGEVVEGRRKVRKGWSRLVLKLKGGGR